MNKPRITTIVLSVAAFIFGVWFLLQSNSPNTNTPMPQSTNNLERAFTIIAFGDSLTAGYGLPSSESYPAQLGKRLIEAGYDVSVINSGVSGETTRGNLERAQFIRDQNPDIVLLGIGGNDALRILPLSETRNNMRETIETLQSGDNPPVILLLQMQAPLNAGVAYKEEFDSLYTSLALETDVTLVPFLTEEVFLDANNKLNDGIHLNRVGYGKVVDLYIVPEVTRALDTLLE